MLLLLDADMEEKFESGRAAGPVCQTCMSSLVHRH